MATKSPEQVIAQFLTYNTKADPANTDQRFLVAGSKNVLINDGEETLSRQGISLNGPAGTTGNPILGSTEWNNSSGVELDLRAHDAVLEVTINGTIQTLMSGLASVELIFDEYWDNGQKIDQLIWSDGSPTVYTWSGAFGSIASLTSAYVMLSGSMTFGQLRFLTSDFAHSVIVRDDAGAYHTTTYELGGVNSGTGISFTAATKTIADSANGFITNNFHPGDTITVSGTVHNNGTYNVVTVLAGAITVSQSLTDESAGSSFTVTAIDSMYIAMGSDFSAFSFTMNNVIMQAVDTHSNGVATGYDVDVVQVIDNQAWYLSRTSNVAYVSKNTSILDCTFSTPRAVGEGAQLTLDGPGRAVGVLKGDVILHAGTDFIYKSSFNQLTVGSTLAETLKVEQVKTTSRQAALHQNLLCNIGNGLAWIGADNQMYELDDATLSYNPSLNMVSDPVKPDFIAANFTGGHMKFDRTRIYISAPLSATNFIYEFRLIGKTTSAGQATKEYFWQPPQTFPIQRWANIGGAISGHSSATDETYTLFSGYNDLGEAIHSIALLAKWDGGVRSLLKAGDEMFNEGGISANTVITASYQFEKDGGDTEIVTKMIDGSDPDILYSSSQDPSLGNNPDGDISLSGDVISPTLALPHFRIIHDINPQEFFNYDVKLETNDVDAQWSWMAHGSNSTLSTGKPTGIKN